MNEIDEKLYYVFDEEGCKYEAYNKEQIDRTITKDYNLITRGVNSDSSISEDSSTARISFTKKNRLILMTLIIRPISTVNGDILLFNEDGTPFLIPEEFRAKNNYYPDFFLTGINEPKIIKIGEQNYSDIDEITTISFIKLIDGTRINGNVFANSRIYYIEND